VKDGDPMDMRCGVCGYAFTVRIGHREHPCPECGAPAKDSLRVMDDVQIEANWHELRILGIWAERWAGQHADKEPGMQRTVARICGRIHAQHPDRSGLTLSADLAELRQAFGDVEVHGFNEDDEANEPRTQSPERPEAAHNPDPTSVAAQETEE